MAKLLSTRLELVEEILGKKDRFGGLSMNGAKLFHPLALSLSKGS
jgi:hypothetical protein